MGGRSPPGSSVCGVAIPFSTWEGYANPCPYCHFAVKEVYASEGLLDYLSKVPTQIDLSETNGNHLLACLAQARVWLGQEQ